MADTIELNRTSGLQVRLPLINLRLNLLENITTGCIFIIVVINVFITAFGVQRPNPGVCENDLKRVESAALVLKSGVLFPHSHQHFRNSLFAAFSSLDTACLTTLVPDYLSCAFR